jgi:hypothetical protein
MILSLILFWRKEFIAGKEAGPLRVKIGPIKWAKLN